MTDITQGFAQLFRGRLDAYGVATDQPYADKVDPPWSTHAMAWAHYLDRIDAHLAGDAPMGVYPLQGDLTVWWGCTDLDGGESDLVHALDIQTMFAAMGITAWVERSRSKGQHVWVFAEEPIPAEVMRNAFLAVHQRLEVPAKEVNPKQVNLDGLQRGLGNFVRLPYPGHLGPLDEGEPGLVGGTARGGGVLLLEEGESARRARRPRDQCGDERQGRADDGLGDRWGGSGAAPQEGTGNQVRHLPQLDLDGAVEPGRLRGDDGGVPVAGGAATGEGQRACRQVVLDPDDAQHQAHISVRDFTARALDARCSLSQLAAVADRYVAPPPRHTFAWSEAGDSEYDIELEPLVTHLTGTARQAFMFGPREGHTDRSATLMRFAYLLHETELFTPRQALELVRDFDRRHGQKFWDRADREVRLMEIVGRAWGR